MTAEYLDVLVLCSDPVNLRRTLNLAQELVHFERVIRRSELPIRMRRVFPPTLEQLQREFARADEQGRRPSVFHFLGHGDDDGLYFETEHGEGRLVKGHELKDALAGSPVKLALLNACWSATKRGVSLIDFLTREKLADAAIGHETPVADESAIEFARQFYALVTQGRTIRDACQRAANSLAVQGKFGAADVELVGDGQQVLTAGLATDGSRPPVIDSGLPKFGGLPEPPVFYGRGEELVQLSRSLGDDGLTGFGLWGIGGIGKTALANVAARRNAWRYEGAVWVDIRDAVHKTTAELLRLALCRLHPSAPDADPAFELARRLQDAPSLVVLDNLEDLPEPEHAALARFVQQVPKNGSRVLLTARVPLTAIDRLTGVQSRRLTEGLDDWNGAHYVQYVARQKQCLALVDELREEGPKLEGLCMLVTRRLHGHPKMLELAVGVALTGRRALEDALEKLPDDVEQQLAALLATSLACLSDDGNRVLPLLGFFPTGSLTPEALEVVGTAIEKSEISDSKSRPDDDSEDDADEDADAEPDLTWLQQGREQLVAAGLLDYDQAHDVYTFHQSILDEARRRRPGDEVSGAITMALLLHYAEYVRSNRGDNERLDRCFENAVVLMESLWSGRDGDSPLDAVLADMTDPLGNYFQHRGLWRLGQTWHQRAIELRSTSGHARNDAALALQHFQQGQVLASHSQPAAAREALNEALRLFEQAGFQKGIGAALHELARIESAQGNPSEARRLLQRSLAIKESLGDQRELAASLHELAILESAQGNPSEARRLLQRSLAILESLGDQRGLSASLHQLAMLDAQTGNRDEARRLWERSIGINQGIGEVAGVATTKSMLAQLEAMDGRIEQAMELASQAVRDLEQLGYAQAEDARAILRSIEQFAAQGGQSGGAAGNAARLNETLSIWKSLAPAERSERLAGLTDPSAEAVLAWLAHGLVCWQERDVTGCEAALARAHTLAVAAQDDELIALVAGLMEQLEAAKSAGPPADSELVAALKLLEQDKVEEALPLLEKCLADARAADEPLAVATCQFYLGHALLQVDRPAEAVTSLREALELATQAGETELIKAVQQVLTIATREVQGS